MFGEAFLRVHTCMLKHFWLKGLSIDVEGARERRAISRMKENFNNEIKEPEECLHLFVWIRDDFLCVVFK